MFWWYIILQKKRFDEPEEVISDDDDEDTIRMVQAAARRTLFGEDVLNMEGFNYRVMGRKGLASHGGDATEKHKFFKKVFKKTFSTSMSLYTTLPDTPSIGIQLPHTTALETDTIS